MVEKYSLNNLGNLREKFSDSNLPPEENKDDLSVDSSASQIQKEKPSWGQIRHQLQYLCGNEKDPQACREKFGKMLLDSDTQNASDYVFVFNNTSLKRESWEAFKESSGMSDFYYFLSLLKDLSGSDPVQAALREEIFNYTPVSNLAIDEWRSLFNIAQKDEVFEQTIWNKFISLNPQIKYLRELIENSRSSISENIKKQAKLKIEEFEQWENERNEQWRKENIRNVEGCEVQRTEINIPGDFNQDFEGLEIEEIITEHTCPVKMQFSFDDYSYPDNAIHEKIEVSESSILTKLAEKLNKYYQTGVFRLTGFEDRLYIGGFENIDSEEIDFSGWESTIDDTSLLEKEMLPVYEKICAFVEVKQKEDEISMEEQHKRDLEERESEHIKKRQILKKIESGTMTIDDATFLFEILGHIFEKGVKKDMNKTNILKWFEMNKKSITEELKIS